MVQSTPQLQRAPNYSLIAGQLSGQFDANNAARAGSIRDNRTAALDSILSNAKNAATEFGTGAGLGAGGLADIFNATTGLGGNILSSDYSLARDERRARGEEADITDTLAQANSRGAYAAALKKANQAVGNTDTDSVMVIDHENKVFRRMKAADAANAVSGTDFEISPFSPPAGYREDTPGVKGMSTSIQGGRVEFNDLVQRPKTVTIDDNSVINQTPEVIMTAEEQDAVVEMKQGGHAVKSIKRNGNSATITYDDGRTEEVGNMF